MAISWVCWLLPLVSVMVQADYSDFFQHQKGRSEIYRMAMKEQWDKMKKDCIEKMHLAMDSLNKKDSTIYLPIKGEATHILMQTTAGKLYTITMPLTEANCTGDYKPGKYDGCEPKPGAQKKVCTVEVLVLLDSEEPFYNHKACQDISHLDPTSPPGEEIEEEGTPHM